MDFKYLKTWANSDAEFDLESYQSVPPCLMMGGGSDVLCQFQTVSQWPVQSSQVLAHAARSKEVLVTVGGSRAGEP